MCGPRDHTCITIIDTSIQTNYTNDAYYSDTYPVLPLHELRGAPPHHTAALGRRRAAHLPRLQHLGVYKVGLIGVVYIEGVGLNKV
jgi:hypothetical protein